MATPAVVYIESFPKNDTPVITPTPGRRGPYENPFDYFNDEFF